MQPETVTWRVFDLDLALGEPEQALRARACARLGVAQEELRGFRLSRKSLDVRGRRRGRAPRYVVTADLMLASGRRSDRLARALRSGEVARAPEPARLVPHEVHASLRGSRAARAVVVGSGPAGLFAALPLALAGLEVTLIERGARLDRRSKALARFHRTRRPDPESNLLFGEGGAGTYSDGKLYTRVDDPLEVPILEQLVAAGARPEILYDSRAHVGTDRLHRLLPRLRARLEAAGVRFAWDTRLEALLCEGGLVRAVRTSAGEIPCDALVLAVGHSARDTWRALSAQGLAFEARAFQLGLRVEHPQELVDAARFGAVPELRALGAASYNLVCKAGDGAPAAHSFCMCPGGRIVASVNEPGLLCTNGMSNSTHSSPYANAAVVTTLRPQDFGPGPFAGVELQRELEARFFQAGGADYTAPAQRVADFVAGRESGGEIGPTSYVFGTRAARLDLLLPDAVRRALARAFERFERAIPGFAGERGLLVGLESRSSTPLCIPRARDTRRAPGFANLYPAGEGAGYAGGIVSAALDGAKSARALLALGVGARA